MQPGILLREYLDEDYPSLICLWEVTGLSNKARGDDQATIKRTLLQGGRILVLLSDNKLIGSSWITNDGRRLYLHHFGIHPDYRGEGLSHLLARASLDYAVKLKMQIKLEVHRTNDIAVGLYEKYGFQYLGDYDVYIIRDPDSINPDQGF